jgi:hypothetical protein
MNTVQDFTAMMKDFMGGFPMDTKAMEEGMKASMAMNEKFAAVALDAAEKSTEISAKWTKDALTQLGAASKVQEDPAAYAKAMTDLASASAEVAAENMAAFAEVAKKVQMDTVELLMAAGKDMSEDAAAAVQKMTKEATAAAKKAAK